MPLCVHIVNFCVQSEKPARVQLDVSHSVNCICNRESTVHVVEVPPQEKQVHIVCGTCVAIGREVQFYTYNITSEVCDI